MDQDRQIRLLIPPFFVFAWLALGALLDGESWRALTEGFSREELFGLGALVAASLLPIGFVLSALSALFLRLVFLPFRRPYEACLSEATLQRIWPRVGRDGESTLREMLYAAVTFDHGVLEPGVHTWLMRRWSGFNISMGSFWAILLAHALAPMLSIRQTCTWWVVTSPVVLLLVLNAAVAWRGVMQMLEFQAHRKTPTETK